MDPEALYQQAKSEPPKAALATYDRLLAQPSLGQELRTKALVNKAYNLIQLNRPKDALTLLDTALAQPNLDPEVQAIALRNRATALMQAKRWQPALDGFQTILKEDLPEDIKALCLHNIGYCLMHLKQHAAALEAIDSVLATEAAPADLKARSLLNKGAIFQRQGQLQDATQAYKTALTLAENDETKAKALGNLAGLLAKSDQWREARPLYDQILALPNLPPRLQTKYRIAHRFSRIFAPNFRRPKHLT